MADATRPQTRRRRSELLKLNLAVELSRPGPTGSTSPYFADGEVIPIAARRTPRQKRRRTINDDGLEIWHSGETPSTRSDTDAAQSGQGHPKAANGKDVAATSSGAGRRSRSEAEGKPEVAAQPGQPAAPPGGDDDKDGGEEAASSAQPGKKANGGGARPKAAASSGSSGRARGRGGGGSGTGGGSGRGRGGRGRRGTASPADEVASGKRRKLSSRVSRRMLVEGKDSESEDRLIERAKEPPYDFTLVPRCADELADSVVIRVASRRMCTYAIGEMFHLCNEAARRQAIRRQQLSGAGGSTDSTNESASRLQSKLQAATEKKPVAAGKHEAAKGSKQPPPPQQPSQPHPKLEVQLPTRVTENGQTTQVHSVPTEQDAPPRVPGQPPASPTVKYVYPDPNTFEKGEIILCPTCSKNMKAPMRARALRCANCRCEIYPKHRKQGWAGALYEQLQQSPTSNVQGPSPRNPAPLKTSSGAAAAKPKATAGGGGGGGGGDAAGLSAKTAPTDGGGSGAQQSRGRGRARGGRSTGGGRNSGGKRRGSAAAGSDSEATSPPSSPRYDKPLSLDYIADRLDIDNPLRGYMVRHKNGGWLQGFILITSFTTWQRWFKWNSLAPEAGLLEAHKAGDLQKSVWDHDSSLTAQMDVQKRSGDPEKEGVIWGRIAELSLLGGLRSGKFLVQVALEELEANNEYDFLVLQATETSRTFYEGLGFVRVGAVAKYVPPGTAIDDCPVIGYRHWTFSDEPVRPHVTLSLRESRMPEPSYMMARQLHRRRSKRSGASTTSMLSKLESLLVEKVPKVRKLGWCRRSPKTSPAGSRKTTTSGEPEDDPEDRPHLCEECGASFKRACELGNHKRGHMREKLLSGA